MSRNIKWWCSAAIAACWFLVMPSPGNAANIRDFIDITPYVEVEGSYDDNIYEISEDASLPEEAKEREDFSFNTRAGVDANITLDRPYLSLEVGLQYFFEYNKFLENTELDDTQHNLDFDLGFSSKYEEGFLRDRLKVSVNDKLSVIPIDEEEPLYSGNRAFRNDFMIGADYKLLSSPRFTFTVGYGYNRLDYFEDEPIDVLTVTGFEDSSELTQESQSHTGKAEIRFLMNSRLTALLNYQYVNVTREENTGVLVSANFDRHNVMGGFQTKFTPRIHGNFLGGYTTTSFDSVSGSTQDDQSDFVAEASVSANFAHQPLMTVGYRKYYSENDFGDTLLTDDVFARMGFRLAQGFVVNLEGDYIKEDRGLAGDEAIQQRFGASAEYDVLKNMKLLAGYNYRKKDFFAQNFIGKEERDETSQVFSGGVQYKVGRHVLLRGMYSYTDKTSNVAEQEFSRNKFTAGGKVTF